MHLRTRYVLGSGLLALALSACGQQTGSNAMPGMNMNNMPSMSASPASSAPSASGAMSSIASPSAGMSPAATPGMDMSGMGGMMSTTTAMANAPFDAQFIDSMIEHHQGAINMAQQALTQAQRPEIKQLAQDIIAAQDKEIGQMQQWRQQWYPDLAPTSGMTMDMDDMNVSSDPSKPFDQRFMEAMIPHHQSAIMMAQMAQQQGEHPEIKQLANEIITAQEQEIGQMRQWLQQWYGVTQ